MIPQIHSGSGDCHSSSLRKKKQCLLAKGLQVNPTRYKVTCQTSNLTCRTLLTLPNGRFQSIQQDTAKTRTKQHEGTLSLGDKRSRSCLQANTRILCGDADHASFCVFPNHSKSGRMCSPKHNNYIGSAFQMIWIMCCRVGMQPGPLFLKLKRSNSN